MNNLPTYDSVKQSRVAFDKRWSEADKERGIRRNTTLVNNYRSRRRAGDIIAPLLPKNMAHYKGRKRKPLNALVHRALGVLREHRRNMSSQEILKHFENDVINENELMKAISDNLRVTKNEMGLFRYNPRLTASNPREILKLLKDSWLGAPYEDIVDTYPGAKTDLDVLIEEEKVFTVRNVKNGHIACFEHIEPRLAMSIDAKKIWQETKVPAIHHDLQKKMVENGIKQEIETNVVDKLKQKPSGNKGAKKKKVSRRQKKITNVHMLKEEGKE